jgi:deoxyribonuclease-4
MQIFCRNPRSWKVGGLDGAEAERFRELVAASGIGPVAVHATYLINLSSPDPELFERSVGLLKAELAMAADLGADYYVAHLGSSRGEGDRYASGRVLEALASVAGDGAEGPEILLENTAGGGDTFGASLASIGEVMEGARGLGLDVGLCFDTCHGFAAGYPMGPDDAARLVDTIEREAGPGRLRLIHLNDSKGGAGSRLDRHDHIGRGEIGMGFFRGFVNHPKVAEVPLILETPKKTPADDPENLATVRGLSRRRRR